MSALIFLKKLWSATPTWLRWTLLVFLLLASSFAYGYSLALYRTSAEAKKLAEVAQEAQAKADAAAKAGEALEMRLKALQAQASAAQAATAQATQAAFQARAAAMPALRSLPTIPDSELRPDLEKLQILVHAQDVQIASMAHELDLSHQALQTSIAESAQYKEAFQQERLRSIALQGQLAAQDAQHRREIMGVRLKWGGGGAATGAALDELFHALHHR